MRVILAFPLLLVAGCSVRSDNGQTSVDVNTQSIENAASDVGNAADEAVSDIGNAARDIENDVGNVHVDIGTDGNRQGNSH